jgi:SpoU rRNA methylase family enzyme
LMLIIFVMHNVHPKQKLLYMAVLEFNLYVFFFLLAIGYPVHS